VREIGFFTNENVAPFAGLFFFAPDLAIDKDLDLAFK